MVSKSTASRNSFRLLPSLPTLSTHPLSIYGTGGSGESGRSLSISGTGESGCPLSFSGTGGSSESGHSFSISGTGESGCPLSIPGTGGSGESGRSLSISVCVEFTEADPYGTISAHTCDQVLTFPKGVLNSEESYSTFKEALMTVIDANTGMTFNMV